MSIDDPKITVTCDDCGYAQEYEMCPLVRQSWDLRYLSNQLKRDGWITKDGNNHSCESCVSETECPPTNPGGGE